MASGPSDTPRDLVIIGADDDAKEIVDAVDEVASNAWRIIGVLDDAHTQGAYYKHVRVMGDYSAIDALDLGAVHFIATLSPLSTFLSKDTVIESLVARHPQMQFATIVHPSAYISPTATVGPGCFVGGGVAVSSDARIGAHCLIHFHSVFGREVELGPYSFVSATVNVTAKRRIGRSVYLAVDCIVNADVGDCVLVGAGTTVSSQVGSLCLVSSPRSTKAQVDQFTDRAAFQDVLRS